MREIRIREMAPEEARFKLEYELNQAFVAGEERVAVLHGIGRGILKKLTAGVVSDSGFASIVTLELNPNPGVTLIDLFPPDRSSMRRFIR